MDLFFKAMRVLNLVLSPRSDYQHLRSWLRNGKVNATIDQNLTLLLQYQGLLFSQSFGSTKYSATRSTNWVSGTFTGVISGRDDIVGLYHLGSCLKESYRYNLQVRGPLSRSLHHSHTCPKFSL